MDAELTSKREPAWTPPARKRPATLLGRLCREEREAWRKHYRRYFQYAARTLGLGFVAGFLYFLIWPSQERKALEFVVKALEDIRLEGSPLVLALTLFYHNARASAIAVAAGAVPFLFLPILDPLLNGGVLGLLASIAKHQGLDVPRLLLTQILPHGVFELTAVIYTTAVGLYVSAGMSQKAKRTWSARRKRKETITGTCRFSELPAAPPAYGNFLETYPERMAAAKDGLARNVVRSFILVVLPLLLVAAFVEGFITPLLR